MIRPALHLRPSVSTTASAAARRAASGKSSGPIAVVSISLPKNYRFLHGPPRRAGFIPSPLRPASSSSSSSVVVRGSSSSSSSSNPPSGDKSSSSSTSAEGAAEGTEDSTAHQSSRELVLTPGEKVVVGTRLFFWAGALAFASVCGYYIVKELLPTKMSPNAVFDRATSTVRRNEEVKRRFGEAFKTYGRDHGGHREGRRNFIEHTEYVDKDTDGSKRTRVRFNLEGQYGAQAFVFAEVSDSMASGEFVYILVQDKRNGAVITVVDNRSMLLARKMAGGSDEGRDVFARLLGTGSGGGGSK